MAFQKKHFQKQPQEFEQRIIDIARVTRVHKGGKMMRFRVMLGIGDQKGRVGVGMAKGSDVATAIGKAFTQAKKNLIKVPIHKGTIPHETLATFKAAKVLIKPAKQGAGVKAGGAVRIVFELAGISNITSKILGTNNKMNNVKAVMDALANFKSMPSKSKASDNKKGMPLDKLSSSPSLRAEGGEPASKKEEKKKPSILDKVKNITKKDNK